MKTESINNKDFRVDIPLPRGKAIRQNCLTCKCGNSAEVKRCKIFDCFAWPWRMGPGQPTKSEKGERPRRVVLPEELDERVARLTRGRPRPSKSKRSKISGAAAQE